MTGGTSSTSQRVDRPHGDVWYVVRGTATQLRAAQDIVGDVVLYTPRVQERVRLSGRARRTITRRVELYPGYGFLCLSLEQMPTLFLMTGIRHMVPDSVTTVRSSELEAARALEARPGDWLESRTSLPPLLQLLPGDRVRVPVSQFAAIEGTVVVVRRGIVELDVPGSVIPVRVDLRRCVRA